MSAPHLQRAWALGELGRFEQSAEEARKAVSLRPEDPQAYDTLATSLLFMDEPGEALQVAEDGLAIAPDDARLHALRACALVELGRYREGLDAVQEGLRLSPEDALLHAKAGDAYRHLKDYGAAESAYRRGMALDPHHPTLARFLAYSLYLQEKYEEAEAILRDALREEAEDADNWALLGHVLVEQNKWEEGAFIYLQGLAANPTSQESKKGLEYAVHLLRYGWLGKGSRMEVAFFCAFIASTLASFALATTVRPPIPLVLGVFAFPLLLRFGWPAWRGRRLDPRIRRVHEIVVAERWRAGRSEA